HLAVRTQPAFAKKKTQNTHSRNNGRACAIKFTGEAPLTSTGCISPPQIPRETRKGREKGTKAEKHVNAYRKKSLIRGDDGGTTLPGQRNIPGEARVVCDRSRIHTPQPRGRGEYCCYYCLHRSNSTCSKPR
ncbi:unnamed protein product, partial [Ectocarpus sp. 8 AP-2014]